MEMAAMLKTVADRRRPWQIGAIEMVRALVKRLWPSSRLHVYGSFESGLAIPPSDVDCVIELPSISSSFSSSPSILPTSSTLSKPLYPRKFTSGITKNAHLQMSSQLLPPSPPPPLQQQQQQQQRQQQQPHHHPLPQTST